MSKPVSYPANIYLALILHAHLPYVRHPEHRDSLEERWLFEAITECYLPLLQLVNKFKQEGVNFSLTFSLSPPLLAMLSDDYLQYRYLSYLDRQIALGEKECRRTAVVEPELKPLAEFYLTRLRESKRLYTEEYGGDLIGAFRRLREAGCLELITTCATHGYLPLMLSAEAQRVQIYLAVEYFERLFSEVPPGFWLPECGYTPGVDRFLAEAGIKYFVAGSEGFMAARPTPVGGVYTPVRTKYGVAVFGRDPASSHQVWDRNSGYPGDIYYREFYRDIGYDLPLSYLEPFLPGGVRVDTGFKYYRITGRGTEKEIYDPKAALERAALHAAHFVYHRLQLARALKGINGNPPVVVAPYDAELFGHWWFEGPAWLEFVVREIMEKREAIELITPGLYLQKYPPQQEVELPLSSWGEGGSNYVWLNPANDWIYPYLHSGERLLRETALLYPDPPSVIARAFNQAAREFLLAQSSDWAFILHSGTTVEYARRRTIEHLFRFFYLLQAGREGKVDPFLLDEWEKRHPIFPFLDYRLYGTEGKSTGSYPVSSGAGDKRLFPASSRRHVIMLSWEFPPRTVGGLARHVYDLSQALVSEGWKVTVLTCPVTGQPAEEEINGVKVVRLSPHYFTSQDFMQWVEELNYGLREEGKKYINGEGVEVIHAHDWLVGRAGEELAAFTGRPLVATIHATEYGRNRGLHNALQRTIHAREERLVRVAQRVIACSHYMAEEVSSLFAVPREKVTVIYNGVNSGNLKPPPGCQPLPYHRRPWHIFFLGRLVPEKGVQVLLSALVLLRERLSECKLLIAGRGPYEDELKGMAEEMGINEQVEFLGFVNDEQRNAIFSQVRVAAFPSLYEPFGIVALEAMAAGVPVVVSDTGGLAEIVEHGVDGLKVPPGDAGMLAHYLEQLLCYENFALNLSRRAQIKIAVEFNWQAIARKTISVYEEVLDSRVK